MASVSVNTYLQQFDDSLRLENGSTTAQLISCRDPHVANPKLQSIADVDRATTRVLEPPWDELVSQHIKVVQNINECSFLQAFTEQQGLIQVLVKILQQQKEENWSLPIMYTACLDIRLLAIQAAKQAQQKKLRHKPGELLEKSAESVMNCFRVCASDNRAAAKDSKRLGMLHLVNQLFKIYYKLNTLHLCKPLIRAIECSPYKDEFAISQQITYRYYVGRKAMFDNDIKGAQELLSFAFERCHGDAMKNKRLILIYLIPVKMMLGYQPSDDLLRKYDLLQFAAICDAIRTGNVLKFSEQLETHEQFFIKYGIYLILERLRMVLYRNLFKRVFHILGTHQIPIEAYLSVLKFMQVEDIDLEETQCILANLIFQGKVKGYISLQHSKLVVSKQNAFPKLTTLN